MYFPNDDKRKAFWHSIEDNPQEEFSAVPVESEKREADTESTPTKKPWEDYEGGEWTPPDDGEVTP
jgi:hypothetical protein